jgi:hypothetical protein
MPSGDRPSPLTLLLLERNPAIDSGNLYGRWPDSENKDYEVVVAYFVNAIVACARAHHLPPPRTS